jgi:dimeric dUTPase (all-alpha-NTP-PPase superfamily)
MLITATELNKVKKISTLSIISLCSLQNQLNELVVPDWLNRDKPYLTAAHMELSEAMNHCVWAWWKKASPSMNAYKLELIDALCFVLSAMLMRYKHMDYKQMFSKVDEINGKLSLSHREFCDSTIKNLELTIGLFCTGKWVDKMLTHVLMLCYDAGMDGHEIVNLYIAKNILNRFRKENGYKEGTYVKRWNNEEDTDYVIRYFATQIEESTSRGIEELIIYDTFVTKIMNDLKAYYVTIAAVSQADNIAAYHGHAVSSVRVTNNLDVSQ